MKINKKYALGAVGFFIVIGALHFVYEHVTYVETDNAQVEAHTVLLTPKVSGFIREVSVTTGKKVKKDEVLVQIDDRDYKAAADSARSELLSLEARKRDAEKNYSRIKSLYAQSVVSAQQYDNTTANYNEIKAKYDSAASHLAQAELNLENTQIKAPSDGIVATTSAEVGQLASAGAPLVGFVSSEARWVIANFKETDIDDIQVGKKVNVTIDAVPGKTYHGTVESISSATGSTFTLLPPDNATGNYTKVVQRVPVKITLESLEPSDYEKIQAGLSAVVKVHIR